LAGVALGGCSWIFVKPLPPDYQRGDPVECTTSVAPPVVDTLLAVSDLFAFFYIAGTTGDKATPAQNAAATSAAVWAVVYTFAAVHGYRATAACREATEDEPPTRRGFPMPRPTAPRPAPPRPAAAPASDEPQVVPPASATPQQIDDDDPGHRRPTTEPPRNEPPIRKIPGTQQ
jgi:hypothetical protein